MNFSFDFEGEEKKFESKNITIELNKDVDYGISINKFGELVICKHQYGEEEGSIILKPSVSNEIRLT